MNRIGGAYECDIFFDAWAAGSARSYVNREIPNPSPRRATPITHPIDVCMFFAVSLADGLAGGFDHQLALEILAVQAGAHFRNLNFLNGL